MLRMQAENLASQEQLWKLEIRLGMRIILMEELNLCVAAPARPLLNRFTHCERQGAKPTRRGSAPINWWCLCGLSACALVVLSVLLGRLL
jgi:hypothetical protein